MWLVLILAAYTYLIVRGLNMGKAESRDLFLTDEKIQHIVAIREYYGTYHHHKEQMAFAATALFLGGAVAVSLHGFGNINSCNVFLEMPSLRGAFFCQPSLPSFSSHGNSACELAQLILLRIAIPSFSISYSMVIVLTIKPSAVSPIISRRSLVWINHQFHICFRL
jgi:hypothetical protein